MTWGHIRGVFAVPDDPSRSGSAPIAVPGLARLTLEAAVFGVGISYDRIACLLDR